MKKKSNSATKATPAVTAASATPAPAPTNPTPPSVPVSSAPTPAPTKTNKKVSVSPFVAATVFAVVALVSVIGLGLWLYNDVKEGFSEEVAALQEKSDAEKAELVKKMEAEKAAQDKEEEALKAFLKENERYLSGPARPAPPEPYDFEKHEVYDPESEKNLIIGFPLIKDPAGNNAYWASDNPPTFPTDIVKGTVWEGTTGWSQIRVAEIVTHGGISVYRPVPNLPRVYTGVDSNGRKIYREWIWGLVAQASN